MADNQAFLRLIRLSRERLPRNSIVSLNKVEEQTPEAINKLKGLIDTISETVAESLNESLSLLSKDEKPSNDIDVDAFIPNKLPDWQ